MNKYVHIIDSKGIRITSMPSTDSLSESELVSVAKIQFPNASNYIYGDDTMLDAFLDGKAYVDGAFVDIPVTVYEPSKAEKIAEIKAYYDKRFKTLEQMVLRRRLINGDISDLQDQYKKLNAEMLAKIKAVK